MKNILTIALLVILAVVLLLVSFFPKYAGYSGGGMMPGGTKYYSVEYSCLGYNYSTTGDRFGRMIVFDGGVNYWCSGIPYKKRCYEYMADDREYKKEINCALEYSKRTTSYP